jgi:hypothetical protein
MARFEPRHIEACSVTADVRLRMGQVMRMTEAIGRKDLRC